MQLKTIAYGFALVALLTLQLTSAASGKQQPKSENVTFSAAMHNGKQVLSIEFGSAHIMVDDIVVVFKDGSEGAMSTTKSGEVRFTWKEKFVQAKTMTTSIRGGILE